MSLLSDTDITAMRTTLNESLPGTAVIQSLTITSNGGGGGTSTWTPSGTAACRVAPMSGSEMLVAGRIASEAKWVITVPATTTVTTADRITSDGRTFNITASRAPRSWELSRRLEAMEQV